MVVVVGRGIDGGGEARRGREEAAGGRLGEVGRFVGVGRLEEHLFFCILLRFRFTMFIMNISFVFGLKQNRQIPSVAFI